MMEISDADLDTETPAETEADLESQGSQEAEQVTDSLPESEQPAEESASLESLQRQIDDLRQQLQLRSGINQDIAECSQRVESLAAKVMSAESEVESAKGELKSAKEKYEVAVRELRELVRDQAAGQQRLPFDSPAATPASEAPSDSGPEQPTPQIDEHADDSITFLSQKSMREILGVDEFNRLKDVEQPVGMTDRELDLLAEADATTIGALDKMMWVDSRWFDKMGRGWGEVKTNKLINSLFAFRQNFPQPV